MNSSGRDRVGLVAGARAAAVAIALGVLLLAACSPAASPAPPAVGSPAAGPAASAEGGGISEADWQALVRAAEQEGKVVVYGAPGEDWRRFFTTAFTREFPRIQVEYFGLGGNEAGARIIAEQKNGVFGGDLFFGGVTTINYILIPNDVLDPKIRELLLLPEVLDTSLWWQGQHWFSDEEAKYHLLFGGSVTRPIAYNTNLVNVEEFQSYKDLLNPKWKGKIVSWDPRRSGASSQALRFFYHHPELGPQFIRDFYTTTDVVVGTDQRLIGDWIAQGRYPVGAWSGGNIDVARAQGLPVDSNVRPLKEGAWMSSAWGAVGVLKKTPHPNAAKVYVNWVLSKAGQTAFQEIVTENSLRTDVPKDKVLAEGLAPQPGFNYVFIDLPKYVLDQKAEEEIRRMTREALEGR